MKKYLMIMFILPALMGCRTENAVSQDSVFIDALLSRMTLQEKIGQMTQVDRRYLKDDSDIQKYFMGSLLSGGNGGPEINTAESWADMVDHYQKLASETRLGIPLIYGVDAVHGHNNVSGATIFPQNIGLGCTGDPDLVRKVAEITALEVAATGIDWTFSPCVAVTDDIRWGRSYEGFSQDPEITAELGTAAVQGYQGKSLKDKGTIAACAKHYIGDGGTTWGTGDNKYLIDRGDTRLTEEALREIHLPAYIDAVNAGVATVMASYNSWNGDKCHGHEYLMTDLLKNELGFKGFIITDWAGINGLTDTYKNDIVKAVNAGVDMVMVPGTNTVGEDDYDTFFKYAVEAVQEGLIPMKRINDAVRRILQVKVDLDLFKDPYASRDLLENFGSDEHRAVAREAVRKSLVVLKNDNRILPVSEKITRIHVAGSAADDIGQQCGGWTITWQGEKGPITPGTSILEAIRKRIPSAEITFSADGSGAAGADLCLLVVGENPYAEGRGDVEKLFLSDEDRSVAETVRKTNVPTIAVLLSGRPMIITDELAHWDAFVAAWLPGTEGAGIPDILFG
nr:glycoside hydrolase family 3 protein [FCB group bacterium]